MARSESDPRSALISAAERLFAEKGVAGVSLREINRAAGQRNSTALQYYFTDRLGLVHAVIAKHFPDIESRRHALLDLYEAGGAQGVRPLAAALVLPLASKLSDPNGGREALQVIAELITSDESSIDPAWYLDGKSSLQRWRMLAEPLVSCASMGLRRRYSTIRFAHAELGRRARLARTDDDLVFASNLIDLAAAMLSAPVAPETDHQLRRVASGAG